MESPPMPECGECRQPVPLGNPLYTRWATHRKDGSELADGQAVIQALCKSCAADSALF